SGLAGRRLLHDGRRGLGRRDRLRRAPARENPSRRDLIAFARDEWLGRLRFVPAGGELRRGANQRVADRRECWVPGPGRDPLWAGNRPDYARPVMRLSKMLQAVDLHAAGEPGRVIVGGVPDVPGRTMFEKMTWLQTHQ